MNPTSPAKTTLLAASSDDAGENDPLRTLDVNADGAGAKIADAKRVERTDCRRAQARCR